jgi:hypothetical protein
VVFHRVRRKRRRKWGRPRLRQRMKMRMWRWKRKRRRFLCRPHRLQEDHPRLHPECHHRHLEVHPRDGGVRCILGVTLDGEERDIGVWEKTVLQNQIFDFVKLKEMLN